MLQSQKNIRGIVAMAVAMLFFVANDACMKLARQSLDTGQVMVMRGMVALAILLAVIAATRSWRDLPSAGNRHAVFRAIVEGLVAALYIGALTAMTLSDITAMIMLTPLILTAMSTLFFGEKVGWRRWSAVMVGFMGILMVIRPGGSDAPLWAVVMAFASTVLVAVRDALTKRMPASIPSLMLTLTTTCATTLAGAMLLMFGQSWQPSDGTTMAAIGVAAICVLIGNYAIIEAFREAEISVVAPFRYSIILWAVILGFFMFGEVPDLLAVAGLALVVGSGLYTAHRERLRRKAEKSAIPTA